MEKLTRQLGKSVTKGRGFISRFMFGDGTLLTWESKMQGLMGRIGGLFDKLGQKILTSVTKLQLLKTTAGEAKLAATQAAAVQTQATARSGLGGAKAAVKVTQEVSGVKDPTKSVSKKSIEILNKLKASAAKWNKALNLADTELRAANEAMAKSGKNILKIRSGSTVLQKAMLFIGKALSESGSLFRLAAEQLGKAIPKIKTGFGWLASMGFKLVNIGGILDGLKGSKALSILTKIFKKVLIVFAIFDIYKGATDETRIQKILGKSKEQATAFEKGISGVSNAIGNFFSGFAHLAGTVIEYLGGNKLGEYLKGVDLAPQVAKVFKIITSIFTAIVNVFKAIFGGKGDKEVSSFTKIIMKIGELIGKFLDMLVAVADGLVAISDGDFSGGIGKIVSALASMFLSIATAVKDAVVAVTSGLASWAGGLLKSLFTSIYDWFTGLFEREKKTSTTGRSARVQQKANGGSISGPGTGRSDSILARVSNGEYVINAKSAKAIGTGRLNKLNSFANGGSVGDAKSYQFLKFQNEGKEGKGGVGSFDFKATMEKFVNHLDAANPAVQKVVRQMEELRDKSTNLTEAELVKYDYSKRVNEALLELNEATKESAEVTKDAAGSIKDLGKAAEESKNSWKGMGKEFTAPIKEAFLEGGSIGNGIKKGIQGLMKSIQSKLLDRAMKPLEDAIDNLLNDIFGGESEGKGTTSSPMIVKDIKDTVGGNILDKITGGGEGKDSPETTATKGVMKAVTDGTKTTGGFFDGLGSLFSQGWEMLSGLFGDLGDSLSGIFSSIGGGGAGGGGGGIGGIFSSLFGGGGGGGHSMIDGIGVSSFFSGGGIVPKKGMRPQYFANGGFAKGTDTVPAMLTPGEMVLNKDQQAAMGGGGVTINQTLNITEAMDPQKFQQELVKNNKIVVGLIQQSYQKRGQMGPQGYGQ